MSKIIKQNLKALAHLSKYFTVFRMSLLVA
jgi:hypothetical protein